MIYGETFSIQEQPFQKELHIDWQQKEDELKYELLHPKAVAGLSLAKEKTSRIIPTSVVLQEALLFFDGDDPLQVAWAEQEEGLWILVKGSPIDLQEQKEREVYFDQMGLFCKTLHIQHIPAKVSQVGSELLIEEVPL